ncbi:unnamed protein product [Didymodactylos carnosus]|uniref:Uncharacterized protein n=1 Tax=Didymodactylos carnosus TaxID=1234261 RepID=A0A814YEG0_9BILA|nr:unnamed protein product [Didymodactylos carnosus]CAF1228706.1 unnamed protein product [Didymodactylos carnosus]CAF3807582.1 unnamed protein product [Didymodactylos carnosus]CAF3991464.1 unnamed protein product [Didymodactylos carnosus]
MDSNKSLTYLNSIQKRHDTVHVIWLDEIFTNADECIAHISSLNEIAKVFLILSKYYAQTIISFVCQLSQVTFIYVMCVSALERGGLSTFLSDDKIGRIFHDENRLFLKLTHDVVRKIDDFDKNYDSTKAIWWYTRGSFLYRELNKALRTEKIEQLFMFRYFISDLHTQLVQLHSDYVALLQEYELDVIMAYRVQTITSDEFQKLEQNIGRFISMNTFISTTTDRDVAIICAGDGSQC